MLSSQITGTLAWFRNHQLRLNLRDQRRLHQNLVWLESNLALGNPSWTPEFIANYLKSRYPDVWYLYHNLREEYYQMTVMERERYRIRMVTDKYLCKDVQDYLVEFI